MNKRCKGCGTYVAHCTCEPFWKCPECNYIITESFKFVRKPNETCLICNEVEYKDFEVINEKEDNSD